MGRSRQESAGMGSEWPGTAGVRRNGPEWAPSGRAHNTAHIFLAMNSRSGRMARKGSGTAGMELDWPITMGSECKDCWKGPEMSSECAGIAWNGPEWTTPALSKCKKNDQIRLTSTRKHPTNLRTKSENKSKNKSETESEKKPRKKQRTNPRNNQRENLKKWRPKIQDY